MDLSRHEGGKLQPHALEAFDKALGLLDPKDEDDNDLRKLALSRKAVLLTTMGDPARAIGLFNQAVEEFGGDADLCHHLGIACSMLGGEHLPQAVDALREAVRLGHIDSYEPLVSVHTERRDLTHDQWAQFIEEMKACEDAERSFCIQFALSKAMHEIGRYSEAFEHVRVANELQLEQNSPVGHKQHTLQATVQIPAIFTREFLHDYANRRSSSKVPVFIIVRGNFCLLLWVATRLTSIVLTPCV
jgi:tetratricopeptide (TPR) repeat protein